MTNVKISQLPDGGAAQIADVIPVARDGGNVQLTAEAVGKLGVVAPITLVPNNVTAGAGPALAVGTPLAAPNSPGGIMLTGSVIGVGTQYSAQLEIHNQYAVGIALFVHSDNQFKAPTTTYFRSRGTQISPTAVQTADILAYPNQIYAYDGASYQPCVTIEPRATENWNSTSHGAAWDFFVVSNGSTNQFRAMQIDSSGFVGINFSGVVPARLTVGGTGAFQVDDNGKVTLVTLQVASSASAPSSILTAGTIGQMIMFGGNLYLCSASGAAGAATWNKLSMSAV